MVEVRCTSEKSRENDASSEVNGTDGEVCVAKCESDVCVKGG